MAGTLTLNLKGEYFDAIRRGTKSEEYRETTPYWRKRIEGKSFDYVEICRGYPPSGPTADRIRFPWRGYDIIEITHPHFGDKPTEVFAIRVWR